MNYFDKDTKGRVNKETHAQSDVNESKDALHHTLGPQPTQAAPGNHNHDVDYLTRAQGKWATISLNMPGVPKTDFWSKARVLDNFVQIRTFIQLTGAIGLNLIDLPYTFAADHPVTSTFPIGTAYGWQTSTGARHQGLIFPQLLSGPSRASIHIPGTGAQWGAAVPVAWAANDRWTLDMMYERAT